MGTNKSSDKSHQEKATNVPEVEPKGIVLNRMYTGSYLSTNLGHEVINMFQADNGKHYLYLNAKGNFDEKNGDKIGSMLLVRYIGENTLEILGWATGLTPAPNVNMTYTGFDKFSDIRKAQELIIFDKDRKRKSANIPKNLKSNEDWKNWLKKIGLDEVWEEEVKNDEGIKYGGANLIDIFGEADQQNIYITYRAEELKTPKKRLFLKFVDDTEFYHPSSSENNSENNLENKSETTIEDTFCFTGYLLGKTTLHQYISGDEYTINGNTWNSQLNFLKDNFYNKQELSAKINQKELENIKQRVKDKIEDESTVSANRIKYKKLYSLLSCNVFQEGWPGNLDNKVIKKKVQEEIKERREKDLKNLNKWLTCQFSSKFKDQTIHEPDCSIKKVSLVGFNPKTITLFDIMPKLQHDENCFSDALKFFIKRDKDHWTKILKKLCESEEIGSICSVKREEDATISQNNKDKKQASQNNKNAINQSEEENNDNKNSIKQKKGGRIDILIRTTNAYIVIENKIKSGINSKKDDSENENQLDRYKYYVNYCILGERINLLEKEEEKNELLEVYKNLTYENFLQENNKSVSIIKEKLKEENTPEIKSYYFILAPDYNMPSGKEQKEYKPIPYSVLTGSNKKKDNEDVVQLMQEYNNKYKNENLWSAFYDAMKRHSYDHENESLYEDMKNTFFTRIMEINNKKTNNA